MRLSKKQEHLTRLMNRVLVWIYIQPWYNVECYVKINSFTRTPEEQRRLFAIGRSKTLNSLHLNGLAFDIQFYAMDGTPLWSGKFYDLVGEYVRSVPCLFWGGDFKNFLDRYHVQYSGEKRRS